MVVYKAMYGDYKKYARPIDMFLSKVNKDKYPDVIKNIEWNLLNLVNKIKR